MANTYFSLVTSVGQAQLSNAIALGQTVTLTEMAVGDGGGSNVTPSESMTALVNEQYRAGINNLQVDPDDSTQFTSELVIPQNVGGWTVREVGIFDSAGNLFAVANVPETVKPVISDGSGRELVVRITLAVTNADAVNLVIDPSIVLATQEWVTQNHIARSEIATTAEAKAGTAGKFPDAAGVHEAFKQFGIGGFAEENYFIGDLNTLKRGGLYYIAPAGNNANTPEGTPISASVLVISGFNSSAVTQLLTEYGSGRSWIRSSSSNVWSPWLALYSEQNNPAQLTGNGYQKLASGLIIQWGTFGQVTDSVSVTFPITFANAALTIQITSGGGADGTQQPEWAVASGQTQPTGFTAYTSGQSAGLWFAIGW